MNANCQSIQSIKSLHKTEMPEDLKKNWFNTSYSDSKIYGTGVDRVYNELINGEAAKKKIIVAVIDSGVDWEHEDLSENIWTNYDEIPENGIDDDNNGYVDDVHGWNFLVDDYGNDINGETMEATRILSLNSKLEALAEQKPTWLTEEIVAKSTIIYNKAQEEHASLANFNNAFNKVDSIMIAAIGENYTFDDAKSLNKDENPDYKRAKLFFSLMSMSGVTKNDLVELRKHFSDTENYHLNKELITRTSLTPEMWHYGNNHYEGKEAEHGTHVAGIIASNRMNNIGSFGIASPCAEIMIVRAVPNGDEHDVDVANAIKYATDNGANIINMSFGKGVSPHKDLVIKAIEYACSKNVLVIHAAGNDNANIDVEDNFPDINLAENPDNLSFLTIGALAPKADKKLLAPFTNYGKNSVDIFAPGVDIYATVPNDKYEFLSGTSMAAPVTAGVAALLWAYHPELSALQLKNTIIDHALKLPKKKVILPGTKKEKVRLGDISKDGSILNGFDAFLHLESPAID